jgi:polyphosphate glucokinase
MQPTTNGARTLAIDIGGSGIKVLILDSEGKPATERLRRPTPAEPAPQVVLHEIQEMAAGQGPFDRIAAGFPGVVIDGVIHTAANLHPEWIGFHLAEAFEKLLGKPARVANDADVQGLAVVEGKGVELVLTLGTGLGSGLFLDGRLVPNLEIGHHPFRKGRTYEQYLGEAAFDKKGKEKWNGYLQEAIENLDRLFNYRMLYLGGGNAKKIEIELPANATIISNVAGLLGGIFLWRNEQA